MKIAVISCPEYYERENEFVNRMFEEGLPIFHLRKPGFGKKRLSDFLGSINPEFHPRIMTHSNYSLIRDFRLRGIHITEKQKRRKGAVKLYVNALKARRKDIKLSAASHCLKEAASSSPEMDYFFLSPVYDSISKTNYKAAFDFSVLEKVLSETENRVMALGGCRPENLKSLKKLGFYGAAFLGFIWNKARPLDGFREILKAAGDLQT